MEKSLQTVFAIGTVLLCLFAHLGYCKEVIFYDDDGSVFTLTITGGCYNFKPKWNNRATEVDIEKGCFKLWDSADCRGQHIILGKSQGSSHKLKTQRFANKISSVNLCSPDEEFQLHNRNNPGAVQIPASPSNGKPGPAPMEETSKLSGATLEEIREIAVTEHNKYRRLHGAPDLKGDENIHADAQKYAEYLATTNKFEPTTMGKYGTNIASSYRRNKVDAVTDAIKRWYDKGKFYDYDRPGYNVGGKPTGSFTAIVWKSTTNVGLGVAWNEADEGWIIVAFYSPAANMLSKFRENVLPHIASSAEA